MTPKKPFSEDVDPVAAEVLLDILLLSIIKANPVGRHDSTTDQKRLNRAKNALFGITTSRGRAPESDLPELIFLAREYLVDRKERRLQRSPSEKVEFGADYYPTDLITDIEGARGSYTLAVEALGKRQRDRNSFLEEPQFSERAHTLQKKFDKLKGPILKMVYGRDGLGEFVFRAHLNELRGLLGTLGISVDDPLEPMRDAKYPI